MLHLQISMARTVHSNIIYNLIVVSTLDLSILQNRQCDSDCGVVNKFNSLTATCLPVLHLKNLSLLLCVSHICYYITYSYSAQLHISCYENCSTLF